TVMAQTPQLQASVTPFPAALTSTSIMLPITIKVSIGNPITGGATNVSSATAAATLIEDAVRRFAASHRGDGIVSVRSGLFIRDGEFTDPSCIHVAADPERVAAVRACCPDSFLGHPVAVRAAAIVEMVGGQDFVSEVAVTSIAYDDDDRAAPEF